MRRAVVVLALALGAVWALRMILGPWAAAFVVGPALCAAVIAGWALLERRLFPDPTPVMLTPRPSRAMTPRQTVILGECEDGVFRATGWPVGAGGRP
jgi:hypothetical protein